MKPYADTNFFPRLYLRHPDSEEALKLIQSAKLQASPPLPITWLHKLEIINAFQLHVFTGKIPGQIRVTLEQAAAAQAAFQADVADSHFLSRNYSVAKEATE